MSHKGFLVATTRYTVNTRMRKLKTSEGAKHKLPQGFGHSSQSSGRAGTSASLSFPQLSIAYKTVKKTSCTRGAGSLQQRKWGALKSKREHNQDQDQGDKVAEQPRGRNQHSDSAHIFF